MSIWNDIRKRGIGAEKKQEDTVKERRFNVDIETQGLFDDPVYIVDYQDDFQDKLRESEYETYHPIWHDVDRQISELRGKYKIFFNDL